MNFCIKSAIFFLLPLLGGCTFSANAQQPVKADTVTNAFFPALAFNSDLGLVGGGMYSRYHYKDGIKPFYSYTDLSALFSTKGLIQTSVFYDKPKAFNSDFRITTDTYLSRFLQNQYYGVGNYEKIEYEPEDNPDYYLFKSFSTGFEITLRYPVITNGKGHQLDALGLMIFDYKTPWGNGSNRLIEEEKPLGYGGARTSALGLGFVWEGRNSEFNPTQGLYYKTTVELGQKIFGSSYNYSVFINDLRAYTSFHLIREITFANRLLLNHTSGSVPYWKMAKIGGELTMRGYPNRRFLDDNSVLMNTELRSWLFDFPDYETKLGGILFMDIGRTFSKNTSVENIFSNLKYTFGFGGTGSFFTPDFILRGDIGFSDEGIGIYFTGGYMF